MAVRAATLDLSQLELFLEEHRTKLSSGTVVVPPQDDELSAQFRLDLILPFRGRVGPIACQVIQRLPDGSTAAQIPEFSPAVAAGIESVFETIELVKQHLLDQGLVVLPGQAPIPPVQPVVAPVAAPLEDEDEDDWEEVEEEVSEQLVDRPSARTFGYELPDLEDEQIAASGSLGSRAFRDFLVDVALNEETGLLSVLEADGTRRFGFWQKGGPVGWRREPLDVDETLGGLLRKARKLTDEEVEMSLDIMDEAGCRQGEALVRMGKLQPGQVGRVLSKQVEFLTQTVLRSREGSWVFHRVARHPERFAIAPVNVPEVLFRAMINHSRNVTSEKLYNMLRPRLEQRIGLRPTARDTVLRFTWEDNEQKLLNLVLSEPPLRVRKLFSITPLTKAHTAGTLWALNEMGFLSFDQSEEDEERKLRRVSGPILRKAEQVGEANDFDVLELHWICSAEDVEQAWKRQRGRFAAANFGQLPEPLTTALAAIEQRQDTVRELLSDDEARRRVRVELVGQAMVDGAVEELLQRARAAVEDHDRQLAMDALEKTLELQPGHEEAGELLAKARSMKVIAAQQKRKSPRA
jgi:hypothetical protein